MNNIPRKLREELSKDPYYTQCARRGFDCRGRITWEHCWLYGGKQIQERWAIIPLCVHHHLGRGLDKKINRLISIKRAAKEDLDKYPKRDWSVYLEQS